MALGLLLGSFCTSATPAATFNAQVAQAYALTSKLKINSGRAAILKELQANPGNVPALLVANYQDFLTLCILQNPADYDRLVAAQEKRLKQIGSLQEKSAWANYSLAEIRMQLAICRMLFGHRLEAAWDFRQAYLQYEANAKAYPAFLPNKKTLGLLQVMIGSVPDSYQWILRIVGMRGRVATGLANLKTAATQEHPFREEALMTYVFVRQLLDQEQIEQAQKVFSGLLKDEPDNLLYYFLAMHLYKKDKKSDKVLQLFLNRPTGNQYLPFPYLHHMVADAYLYKGQLDRSIQENSLFLKQHPGTHYRKAAHFKLYLAYWLDADYQKANYHYNRITEEGETVLEEDNYAARFVEKKEQFNKYLLWARLRSDGGYYKEALADANKLEITSETPVPLRAEYLYRKARIFDGMEEDSLAKKYYDSTISTCRSTNLYFAPNAALHLGYIYQEENNKEKARAYYKQALSYKGHEYKNSIDNKAKLALSSL